MKASGEFKTTINNYLQARASQDELFAKTLKKEGKNLDDCITYIMNTVQKSGCNGFTDDEVFGWAVHYYDEDTIDIGKPNSNARVVVNHVVELTQEEKDDAHKKALDLAVREAQEKITKKKPVCHPLNQSTEDKPLTLF